MKPFKIKSCGCPFGFPRGNVLGTLPWESCGDGMGMGTEIPFLRQYLVSRMKFYFRTVSLLVIAPEMWSC